MDTISRRVDLLEHFFLTHSLSWQSAVEMADLLLLSVSQVCPEHAEQVRQRFEQILASALTRQPPPKI